MTQPAPTIIIVACEESGDNYGAGLAKEILAKAPNTRLIGIGGRAMAEAGVDVRINMVEHSVMGLAEVLSSIGFFMNAMKTVEEMAAEEGADAAILIDSPDFNLRLAPKLKSKGMKIAYFVSPQMWAWREGRVSKVQKYVDEMLCILPFEEEWYRERNASATYVGHPLMDLLDFDAIKKAGQALRDKALQGKEGPLVGILPGSRGFEIKRLLPRFLRAGREFKDRYPHARFAIGCSEWLNPERARDLTARFADLGLHLEHGNTHALMSGSDFLLSCSGTATLEAALIGTPMVMAYHLKWLTYAFAATCLFNSETMFSLPNIILDKRVVPELIQMHADPTTIAITAGDLYEANCGAEQKAAFVKLREIIGGPGAIANAATRILSMVE